MREKLQAAFESLMNEVMAESGSLEHTQRQYQVMKHFLEEQLDRIQQIQSEQGHLPEWIHNDQVSLSVVDSVTGTEYRRVLPIEYRENSNGILLRGEDAQGNPTEIAFLSESAMRKLMDVTGHGPDESPCGEEH